MKLDIAPSDYAKFSIAVSAVVFLSTAILAFSWYGKNGFDTNTVIAVACAIVSAVALVVSSWIFAKFTRAERLENVDVNLRFVPGEGKKEEPEKQETEFKLPKQ